MNDFEHYHKTLTDLELVNIAYFERGKIKLEARKLGS